MSLALLLEAGPLLPGYTWDAGASRFRNDGNGQFVSRKAVLDLLGAGTRANAEALRAGVVAFQRGELDQSTFLARQTELLRRAYLQNAALGAGGWEQLGPKEWGRIGGRIWQQYAYLRNFAQEIADGKVTEAQAINRMNMYLGQARKEFFTQDRQSRKPAEGDLLPLERRHLSDVEHCTQCVIYHDQGWQPAGVLPLPTEQCDCGGNCRCWIEQKDVPAAHFDLWIGSQSGPGATLTDEEQDEGGDEDEVEEWQSPQFSDSLFWEAVSTSLVEEWDESLHPREPAGSPEGGQFAPAGGAASGPSFPDLATVRSSEDVLQAVSREVRDLAKKTGLLAMDQRTFDHLKELTSLDSTPLVQAKKDMDHFVSGVYESSMEPSESLLDRRLGIEDLKLEKFPESADSFLSHSANLGHVLDAVAAIKAGPTVLFDYFDSSEVGEEALSERGRAMLEVLRTTPLEELNLEAVNFALKNLEISVPTGVRTAELLLPGGVVPLTTPAMVMNNFGKSTTLAEAGRLMEAVENYGREGAAQFGTVLPERDEPHSVFYWGVVTENAANRLAVEIGVEQFAQDEGLTREEAQDRLEASASLIQNSSNPLMPTTGSGMPTTNLAAVFLAQSDLQHWSPPGVSSGWPPATLGTTEQVARASQDVFNFLEVHQDYQDREASPEWLQRVYGDRMPQKDVFDEPMTIASAALLGKGAAAAYDAFRYMQDNQILIRGVGGQVARPEDWPPNLEQAVIGFKTAGENATVGDLLRLVNAGAVDQLYPVYQQEENGSFHFINGGSLREVNKDFGGDTPLADLEDLRSRLGAEINRIEREGNPRPDTAMAVINSEATRSYIEDKAAEWHVTPEEARERLTESASLVIARTPDPFTGLTRSAEAPLYTLLDTPSDFQQWASEHLVPDEISVVAVRLCDDTQLRESRSNYESTWDRSHHTNFRGEVVEAYEVLPSKAVVDAYDKAIADRDNESDFLYHGTSYGAGAAIATEGFRIDEVKTGRWLGDGVYLSTCSSKSTQYVGTGWSHDEGEGVVLECRAALGDRNDFTHKPPPDAPGDSVWLQPGLGSDFLNHEVVVRDPTAVRVFRLLRVRRSRA